MCQWRPHALHNLPTDHGPQLPPRIPITLCALTSSSVPQPTRQPIRLCYVPCPGLGTGLPLKDSAVGFRAARVVGWWGWGITRETGEVGIVGARTSLLPHFTVCRVASKDPLRLALTQQQPPIPRSLCMPSPAPVSCLQASRRCPVPIPSHMSSLTPIPHPAHVRSILPPLVGPSCGKFPTTTISTPTRSLPPTELIPPASNQLSDMLPTL